MTDDRLNPDFSGAWKLDIESSLLKAPAPTQTLMQIDHRGSQLLQQVVVTRADGAEVSQAFAFEIGAETTAAIAGMQTRTWAQWRGDVRVIEVRMSLRDREACLRDHWSLSADRQILTMAHPDDDLAGQVSILKKVPDSEFDST